MKPINQLSLFILAGFFLAMVIVQDTDAASYTTKKTIKQTNKITAVSKNTMKENQNKKLKKKSTNKYKPVKTPRPVPKGPGDPDLLPRMIGVTRRGEETTITARITNVGEGNFVSGAGQAAAWIQVVVPHLSGPGAEPIIKSVPITRINSGRSLTISGSFRVQDYFPDFLHWGPPSDTADGCEASMNETFIICVSYDPDLHMDGNEQNDDELHGNDRITWRSRSNARYTADCPM